MKLWLDDLRPKPKQFDLHATTAAEAIHLLETGQVTEISLDYDLGSGGTGGAVADWIVQAASAGRIPPLRWDVHSSSQYCCEQMRQQLLVADAHWQSARSAE